jgi:hypothetical protein
MDAGELETVAKHGRTDTPNSQVRIKMKYYGLTINLKDDPKVIETYKEYHRHLWPEVEASLHRAGIARTRYSCSDGECSCTWR